MKLRGLRSMNIVCCILFIIFIIFTLIILFIIFIIHTYIVYNNFVKSYPFSTVPFWKDNRTINKKPLLPVLNVENVNLSNATIVITACCRNVRKHLAGFQRNIRSITALFGIYHIYLCESDSSDGTFELLNEWQKSDPDHVRVYSKGHQQWTVVSRKFN
jgi:cellulose synthase/poly-beta-1,6-N-acetylglucosamine synthase-like glycosyltransferase